MPRKKKNKPQTMKNHTDTSSQNYSSHPPQQEPQATGSDNSMAIRNGLTDAIFGNGNQGVGSQLSQVDTMFKNNRWYLVSNLRQLLSESYVEFGIIQTIVDVPVDDAFRGGIIVKSKQLDDDDITKLLNKVEREDDINTVAQANKWNRLFGGAGILILTDQDPKKPLEIDRITKDSKVEFRALDMWELYYTHQNTDDYAAAIDGSDLESEFFDYYGQQVHNSRVLKLKGILAPSFVRPRLRGWGVSVIESMIRSVNQYLKATDLSFEVLDEFKVDVFKIKGLAQTLLTQGGTEKVQARIQLANQQKNYQHAITMDGEDDYVQKQLSFAGLDQAMDGIRKQLASDLRMPLTKLFGVSAAGFSSGEDDIENYNSMVESTIRSKTKFELLKVLEIRCQQLFGMVPDDLEISFVPLRMLSSEQEEAVKSTKFGRLIQARQAGEISSSQFKEACNLDDLLPIKLEVDDTLYPSPMTGKDVAPYTRAVPPSTITAPDTPEVKNSMGVSREVSVVGIICEDYILTGQRKDNGRWTFPCGGIEAKESPDYAARRETREECGIDLDSTGVDRIGYKEVEDETNGSKIGVHAFISRIEKREMPKTISDPDHEVKVWRWVPLSATTPELMPDNRHAKNDIVLEHLFGGK